MAAKKKTSKKGSRDKTGVSTVDPRAQLASTPANLTATLEEATAVVGSLRPPDQPGPSDLVDSLLHMIFAEGLPCSFGQAALNRIDTSFVDRNEFRLTEAYETADLLADLEIPDLFNRCTDAASSVGQIYNDQNDVSLELLREATVAERNSFFARVPGVPPTINRFLVNVLAFEELLFSDRSTLRVQQRLGLEVKEGPVGTFIDGVRKLLQPFGHIPIQTLAGSEGDKPQAHELCPTCLLVRLAPHRKK